MRKTIGIIAVLALAAGLSLQASAQGPSRGVNPTDKYVGTKAECERRADARYSGSPRHSDRHWFVLRCMTES